MSLQCDNLSGELQDQWSSSSMFILLITGIGKINYLNMQISLILLVSVCVNSLSCDMLSKMAAIQLCWVKGLTGLNVKIKYLHCMTKLVHPFIFIFFSGMYPVNE